MANVKISDLTDGGVVQAGDQFVVARGNDNVKIGGDKFAPATHTHAFADLTAKPTTLSGYGITDAPKDPAAVALAGGLYHFDDFDNYVYNNAGGPAGRGVGYNVGGAYHSMGSAVSFPAPEGSHGCLQLSFGTSTTASHTAYKAGGGVGLIVQGGYEFNARVFIPTFDGTSGSFGIGLGHSMEHPDSTEPGYFIHFMAKPGQNGGRWQGRLRNNTTNTNVDLGVSVAATTVYKLKIIVNTAGTQAEFFINGTSRGTVAIPADYTAYAGLTTAHGRFQGTQGNYVLIDYWSVNKATGLR